MTRVDEAGLRELVEKWRKTAAKQREWTHDEGDPSASVYSVCADELDQYLAALKPAEPQP
jgi:hypothetical protein